MHYGVGGGIPYSAAWPNRDDRGGQFFKCFQFGDADAPVGNTDATRSLHLYYYIMNVVSACTPSQCPRSAPPPTVRLMLPAHVPIAHAPRQCHDLLYRAPFLATVNVALLCLPSSPPCYVPFHPRRVHRIF
jgi:hypothetical protein